jgi:hypothetical protein
MEYRETTCIECGTKIIDRSTNRTRKFCSDYCAQANYRKRHGAGVRTVTPPCIHNEGVLCGVHKCGVCGWNPKVEQKRKEAVAYG